MSVIELSQLQYTRYLNLIVIHQNIYLFLAFYQIAHHQLDFFINLTLLLVQSRETKRSLSQTRRLSAPPP
ncbi:MAG: hypothetical protein ACTSPP_03525 [Candidatus Heimdallarchaeaceae archaeon]